MGEDVQGETMTAMVECAGSEVAPATADDLKAAVASALARAGCTFGELAEQARTGDFTSLRARLAWVAIGDLEEVRDDEQVERCT